MTLWVFVVIAAALFIQFLVIVYGRREAPDPKKWLWLKDTVVPVMTSMVVALLGIGFALESNRRQTADAEAERQTSLMRELIVSRDRRDTSYLLALDNELNIHLHRYIEMRKKGERTRFEEEAAFFFYSKHRAALVNLRSNKSNLVFRRIWMENVFEQLAIHVVECVLGATEKDPQVSAEGEAATYWLFGAGVQSTSGRDPAYKLGGHMVLANFDRLINDQDKSIDPHDQDVDRIKKEFEKFQVRLHNGDEHPPSDHNILTDELIDVLLAMQGLVAYSSNNVFSAWYGLGSEKLPTNVKDLPAAAPQHFLDLIWYDFEPSEEQRVKHWDDRRQAAWKVIRKFCPKEAMTGASPKRN
jgi:hypothetical protein